MKNNKHYINKISLLLLVLITIGFLFGCSEVVGSVETPTLSTTKVFDLNSLEEYHNIPYTVVNENVPYFTEAECNNISSFEYYSPLDSLGRCGVTMACIGKDLMPTEKRGQIGSVKPTGWKIEKYDCVDGNYLYNRCHLIAYMLSGENANERNLITGTRYMNVQGMLPFETMVCDYIKETGNHVLYRVTPFFKGENLLASGVLMEAKSLEDHGDGILFNVFCYNVQPDIEIDYTNGESYYTGQDGNNVKTTVTPISQEIEKQYILNVRSKKIHLPDCVGVSEMNDKNKKAVIATKSSLEAIGYTPCKSCKP